MGRPKKAASDKKGTVLTIRLTADQMKNLDELVARIEASRFPVRS